MEFHLGSVKSFQLSTEANHCNCCYKKATAHIKSSSWGSYSSKLGKGKMQDDDKIRWEEIYICIYICAKTH